MSVRFFQKRTVWLPTWPTVLICFALFAGTALWWLLAGESFLTVNAPVATDTLIVEGWIGRAPLRAAAEEITRTGYTRVVATGVMTDGSWNEQRWSYADIATRNLVQDGVPRTKLIAAHATAVERQRTFESARAALRALESNGLHPSRINVFTRGTHGRRTRLVYEKVFGPDVEIGIISWVPPGYESTGWWRATERAEEFLKESIAYLVEKVFGGARTLLR